MEPTLIYARGVEKAMRTGQVRAIAHIVIVARKQGHT